MIDFVNCPYKGAELLPLERERLYNWVFNLKPKDILEIGTGNGGSTYYMAEAIKAAGISTVIITCDPQRKVSNSFFETYPFVDYFRMSSDKIIPFVIEEGFLIDFIFFDGPDDPEVALRDIKRLEVSIASGTYFAMHDWDFPKAEMIRPYMELSPNWIEQEVLFKSEVSVGLCLYKYEK
jgi:predicted O-methyltransferase YrrM